MKIKMLITPVIICCAFFITKAQDSTKAKWSQTIQKKNSWYLELGGSSIIGATLNYERFFSKKPGGLSVRVGAGGGFVFAFDDAEVFGALPVSASYNIPISSDKRHFLEIGGGYTLLFSSGENTGFITTIAGWRYDVNKKGLHLRATLIPVFVLPDGEGGFGPWAGFSIGKRF